MKKLDSDEKISYKKLAECTVTKLNRVADVSNRVDATINTRIPNVDNKCRTENFKNKTLRNF